MSVSLLTGGLLVLAGLSWFANGLLNFSESQRQFCDLYCSLSDILPKEAVNVLFLLLGVLAIGLACFTFYEYFRPTISKDKEISISENSSDSSVTSGSNNSETVSEVAPIEEAHSLEFQDVMATEGKNLPKPTSSTRYHKTGGCCGR